MRHLGLYLFKQLSLAFLFTVVAVSFVVLFSQSFRLLSFVVDNSGTTLIFFQLMGLMLFPFLPVIIPLGLGIATIFTYHKLAADSELVVMRAIGASPLYLTKPALILAGLVMLLGYLLTLWLTPLANRGLVDIQSSVRDNFSVLLIKAGTFNDVANGVTFYAREKGSGGALIDLLIHDVRNPKRPVTVMAEQGLFMLNANGVPEITVFKGKRQEIDTETGRLSQLDFDRYVVELNLEKNKVKDRTPNSRELSTGKLVSILFANDEESKHYSRGRLLSELHTRLSSPLLAFSYCITSLAAILAGAFSRRGSTQRIVIAAAILVVLQASVLSLCTNIAKHEWLSMPLYVLILMPIPVGLALLGLNTWGFPKRLLFKKNGGAP